jgi:carotenoid cleavage dioxygenase-like enzyme
MVSQYQLGLTSQEQEITIETLPVSGQLPAWLAGTLLRNGPAEYEVGNQKYRHWFDGLAMIHRFSFRNGDVSYANKFLRTPAYSAAMAKGEISYGEFATDPCRSLFKRLTSLFTPAEPSANANVNITKLNEHFLALTETPMPIEFDPQTLETVGVFDYGTKIKGQLTTAHPHYDPALAAGINYLTHFSARSVYNVYAFDARGRGLLGSIPVREPSYMHSFGMTEHFIILVEFPLRVQPLSLLLRGKPFIENFAWKPQYGTRFLVMKKADGKVVRTYESDAFFAFHHINAFEREGDIFVDISAYADASIINQFYIARLLGPKGGAIVPGQFRRYRLPARGTTAEYETLTEESIELPRIHYERANGRDYRFAYGVSRRKAPPDDFFNQLVKVDAREGTASVWFEEGCYPGEPVFVAAPNATTEDEGIILSVVLDGRQQNSFLLLLDAQSWQESARAVVPQHIPFGFHGIYAKRRVIQ